MRRHAVLMLLVCVTIRAYDLDDRLAVLEAKLAAMPQVALWFHLISLICYDSQSCRTLRVFVN